jgi:hypothetical protein
MSIELVSKRDRASSEWLAAGCARCGWQATTGRSSNRHEFHTMQRQVEIALADPVFDPHRQISRKFSWSGERPISAIGVE